MTPEQFIEKAIDGGWMPLEKYDGGSLRITRTYVTGNTITIQSQITWGDGVIDTDKNDFSLSSVLLNPLAWQAVGRVEGWNGEIEYQIRERMRHESSLDIKGGWDVPTYYMHRMIDALAEGKTIEEYLKTL